MVRQVVGGWVDPGDVGHARCLWWLSESLGLGCVGVVEDGLAVSADGVMVAVVDAGGGVVADAGVAVVMVVVGEELIDERSGVGEAGEAFGEPGCVLQRLEL